MGTSRPTLKDIAERSGFALRTVKKVMSGDTSVREKNRDAILQAAAELNYTPNRAASALGKQKQIRLAVVYSRFTDLYFPDVERGFQNCISELFDYGLDLEFHITQESEDIAPQRATLETLANRDDIDGVVLQPLNPTLLNDSINALVSSGKPVAIFGTDAPDSNRLFHVSCNGYRAGRIAGQLMAKIKNNTGNIYVLNNSTQTQMVARMQGFIDRLREDLPAVPIVTPDLESTLDYYPYIYHLVANQKVAGIYCTDAHVVHAGQALQDLGRTDIPVIGFDLSELSASMMHSKYIDIILDQRPQEFSYLSAKLLFEYLSDGIKPDPIYHTPLYILTSECLETD